LVISQSVTTITFAQQVSQQLLVEARADLLERASVQRRPLENRIGGHHAADVRGEGAEERLDVRVEWPGEARESAVTVVTVESVLLRAVPDPVLDHRQNAG